MILISLTSQKTRILDKIPGVECIFLREQFQSLVLFRDSVVHFRFQAPPCHLPKNCMYDDQNTYCGFLMIQIWQSNVNFSCHKVVRSLFRKLPYFYETIFLDQKFVYTFTQLIENDQFLRLREGKRLKYRT